MSSDLRGHCGHCGRRFADLAWPRVCGGCGETAYHNPIPVAVVLVPVADGLLVIRRAIEPGRGEWALPGGFLEVGEPWQVGAARELVEETGLVVPPSSMAIVEVHSTADTRLLLLFCAVTGPPLAALPPFVVNDEVSALEILRQPRALAFPLHSAVSARFLAGLRSRGSAGA